MEDRHYCWVVVGYTLVMQAVVLGIIVYCFALFAVPFIEQFDASRSRVMLAIGLLQIGTGAVSPLAGRLMDAVPMRYLNIAGVLVMALGLWLVARAQSFWVVLAVYASVYPVAMALCGTMAAQTLVTRCFTARRGVAIGISATGTNVGGVMFPLLAAHWMVGLGWRTTLEWLALLTLAVMVPLCWLVLRREPRSDDGTAAGAGAAPARHWTTREIFRSPLLWIPVVGIMPLNIAFGAIQFNLGAYSLDLGLTQTQAGQLIALCSATMIAGKFFFGGLGDRLDHRVLYWLAAAAMSGALFILAQRPPLWLLVSGIVLVGLAGGGILPMIALIFAARFGSASFGRVLGIVMLFMTVGALGPLLAGAAYDATGGYEVAFLGFLGLMAPAAWLMRRLPAPG